MHVSHFGVKGIGYWVLGIGYWVFDIGHTVGAKKNGNALLRCHRSPTNRL